MRLFSHCRNGKDCQLPQSPVKCSPITLYFWIMLGRLCRPHQDMNDLFHRKSLRWPSDLSRFLKRSQELYEPISILRIQVADPRSRQLGESLFQLRHVLRLAEKLKSRSKIGIEQPGQTVYRCAFRMVSGGAPLSHLGASRLKCTNQLVVAHEFYYGPQ